MRLVVGLGNPGKQYEYTRHNLGFRVANALSNQWGIKLTRHKCLSLIGEKKHSSVSCRKTFKWTSKALSGSFSLPTIILAKPLTFVNGSGEAVKALCDWLKIGEEEILVICDDFNLEKEKLRLRKKGSSGGHNGLESIIESLSSEEFPRLRLGIGRPEEDLDPAEYVLQKFSEQEESFVEEMVGRACQVVEAIITEGIDAAVSRKW
ncbi:MAG: aminoacyl-tRNA hydrolase [bacterium]